MDKTYFHLKKKKTYIHFLGRLRAGACCPMLAVPSATTGHVQLVSIGQHVPGNGSRGGELIGDRTLV